MPPAALPGAARREAGGQGNPPTARVACRCGQHQGKLRLTRVLATLRAAPVRRSRFAPLTLPSTWNGFLLYSPKWP